MNPKATLLLSVDTIYFRFSNLPSQEFWTTLTLFKRRFPFMHWNASTEMWELPVYHLKSVYETSRARFGPENVNLVHSQDNTRSQPIQPQLFEF